jgi:hypothetical protein
VRSSIAKDIYSEDSEAYAAVAQRLAPARAWIEDWLDLLTGLQQAPDVVQLRVTGSDAPQGGVAQLVRAADC